MPIVRGKPWIGSTEPGARKVMQGINERQAVPVVAVANTANQTTAQTPQGIKRTPAEGAAQLQALREKQAQQVAAAKKKKPIRKMTNNVGLRAVSY